MKIKFLADRPFIKTGEIWDIPDTTAESLIAEGTAELVAEAAPEAEPAPRSKNLKGDE